MNFRAIRKITNNVIMSSVNTRSSMGKLIKWANIYFKIININALICSHVDAHNIKVAMHFSTWSELNLSDKLEVTERILNELSI